MKNNTDCFLEIGSCFNEDCRELSLRKSKPFDRNVFKLTEIVCVTIKFEACVGDEVDPHVKVVVLAVAAAHRPVHRPHHGGRLGVGVGEAVAGDEAPGFASGNKLILGAGGAAGLHAVVGGHGGLEAERRVGGEARRVGPQARVGGDQVCLLAESSRLTVMETLLLTLKVNVI